MTAGLLKRLNFLQTLRWRVLAALVGCSLVPVVLNQLASHFIIDRSLQRSEYNKYEALSSQIAGQIGAAMESAELHLQTLANNPILVSPDSTDEERKDEMIRIVKGAQIFSHIVLYDADGIMIDSTSDRGFDPQDTTFWFKDALAGSASISTPQKQLGREGLFLNIYIPVEVLEGEPARVIKGHVPFEPIWKIIDRVSPVPDASVILLDPFGNMISHRDKSLIFQKFKHWSAEEGREVHEGSWIEADGKRYFCLANVLPSKVTRVGHSWTLLLLIPEKDVLAVAEQSNFLQLLSGSFAIGAAFIFGLYFANRLAMPVIKAAQAAREVARGALETRIPEAGPREMRELARDFNQMVSELKEHRNHLEALVAERTESLQSSQSELEELTAQLRASYDSTREGILVMKLDGEVITVNKRFCETFSLPLGVKLSAQAVEQRLIKSFEEGDEFRRYWEECNTSLTMQYEREWTISEPRELNVSMYTAPVKNSSGQTFARIWMMSDLTEQRRLEQGLRQAQKMEAIGRLAGGVAHDFNNLLTGIIGNLSLVEMARGRVVDSGETDKLVASAKHAGQRAAELVKQLLGFSRQSHLKLEYCMVNGIIEEVRDLLVHTIDPRIQIQLDLNPSLWGIIADPNQIQQVMMNMTVNAKDAITEGGRIRMSTRNIEISDYEASLVNDASPGDYVRISVEDTGTGMTPEVRSKIFEPFFTTKEQGKGTGLGLATSYGIIQQHGGWIACESEVGVGTTFHVFLPKGVAPLTKAEEPIAELPVEGGSETVLLVDDETVVRMVGEGVLKHHGYRVITAANGEEALEKIAQRGADIAIVMLDLTMPRLSGKATFQKMRERYLEGTFPFIPVVVCSGYLVDLSVFESETGFRPEGFVQKPYDSDELARTLRNAIDRHRAVQIDAD